MAFDEPVVFVVDDDEAVRESLEYLVDSAGLAVETFADAQSFLDGYDADRWSCLVLDVRLPGMDGLSLYETLVNRGVTIPAIVITGHGDVPMAVRAMKSGAMDFLEKPFAEDALLDRIRVAIGQDAHRRADREELADCKRRVELLSPREREILDYVVDGLPSRAIASKLGISDKTVETHRCRITAKTGAASLAHLVRIALIARGVTPPNNHNTE